ncbi:single-stranded-DNA-specific exonuclease RecJ [Comamonas serinivorans]|uniref:Single-stranded-DNA-specific exonuclease RecJ n=1 Tax=Comamonas serinivorans TaxID=1082851 RepID=A0A1Y0EKP7_9BURK|nr:single-stranded-DNA-specific exonuclease RecJ [Comamonas serinivorans]ARU04214.1 single-stranded-DNA-specific exonuclease RecJ [Comamonas serinivorans]
MRFEPRDAPPRATWALTQAGLHPLLAQLYAARGVQAADLDDKLTRLLPPDTLQGTREAARLLADAIAADQRLVIVADYDCDGATACAVALRGLRMLGARQVDFVVPDRVVDGYGLTPAIADRVKAKGADLLITVDNGIASADGVAHAQALGLQVLVTDHHLPGPELPAAEVIVNPNQPGCTFASKHLAGVGVMFYVLMALRAELRARGVFTGAADSQAVSGQLLSPLNGSLAIPQPKLDALLPLVALGTVADVVRLDANNRRLVAQGLKRIRAGHMPPGLAALFQVAGREAWRASTFDFGFALGPRINAAGRLSDMTLGITLLSTDDPQQAHELATKLDAINRERRVIEADMREQAEAAAAALFDPEEAPPPAVTVFDPDFHEGVIGIVASRLKEQLHRPCFVFAPSGAPGHEHELKGSGRSIEGFHLRDALDLVAKRAPGVLKRFGGHAMAAGCTIAEDQYDRFERTLAEIAAEWLDDATLTRRLATDGPLPPEFRQADIAELLDQAIWGQGFAAPVFSEALELVSQRIVGERHLALKLRHQGQVVDAIWFGRQEPVPAQATLAYRLESDDWKGQRRVRFVVQGMADA